MPKEPYCPYCGLIDENLCQTVRQADNCPHAPNHIPPDELDEIEDLI